MKKNGFTLIEMLVVMLVITVLLLITIPNVLKHNSAIHSKGCDALVKTVQAQVQVYKIENQDRTPTIDQLKTEGYLKEDPTCAGGKSIVISTDGEVQVAQP
ncbi:competence type IV pilus major pilin ComGC [Metabacillus iocasae]|uniref:ComG operon protein 3 n=1 Tax=Priestia iocasae TaxID=2291674 RepID=A0ABS2QRE4_9BACI|nr:competence type IV pilus major pilin ComGC [Metabacillus iocasae]MBM7701547.1 competence protein ComGC [Metabacillus iocasae]